MIYLITCLIILIPYDSSLGGSAYSEERSLKELIRHLEQKTGYRVLYRDALIAGLKGDMELGSGWETEFTELLNRYDLDAKIDPERRQVVIYRQFSKNVTQTETLTLDGYVIDDKTGERLPFSTVIWENDNGEKSGTQTNRRGAFRIQASSNSELNLQISHIGYLTREITLSPGDISEINELSLRMEPASFEAAEIVVKAFSIPGAADTVYQGMLKIGAFSPLGESNSIRMLQTLPSVGFGSSLSDGGIVRGSNPDALQVLLDGSVIYNQSHLFGLVDSFNADAIRTSSFHYDIAPARYQAPPGGTLNLITKSGSLNEYGGNIGLGNSVIRGSLEGPLIEGRSSILLSGRRSILDTIDWFNTGDMIAWGLDIDRDNSLDGNAQTAGERLVRPGDYNVVFYDLHGKFFWEGNNDNRWIISAYSGYNNTLQNAERITQPEVNPSTRRFEMESFDTRNRWGNNAVNLGYSKQFTDDIILETRSGISYYHTRYLKEDFTYQRPQQQLGQQIYVSEFENKSELTHWHFAFDLEFPYRFDFGAALHGYRSAYLENSLNRSQFFQRNTPLLAEMYAGSEFSAGNRLDMTAGGRLQYYTDGGYLKFSPRIHTTILPGSPVSFGMGYSRNYQYLFRLIFYNLTTSDIWITATDEQKPSTTDQLTGGIYIRPWRNALFQTEGYFKWQQDLRFHEMNIQSTNTPFDAGPWYFDNEGFTRGIEFLFRQIIRPIAFTQTYTLGKTELKNPRLNNGQWYYANWDRRHQLNTMITMQAMHELKIHMNWLYATGVPDRLDLLSNGNDRLGDYSRIDVSIEYSRAIGNQKLNLQAGIYNLMNRNNPWYRDWILTIEERTLRNRFTPVQADVYDLGFQPSFSVSYHF